MGALKPRTTLELSNFLLHQIIFIIDTNANKSCLSFFDHAMINHFSQSHGAMYIVLQVLMFINYFKQMERKSFTKGEGNLPQ